MKNKDKFLILEDDELRLELSLCYNDCYYYHIYQKSIDRRIGNCGIRLNRSEENNFLGNIEYEIYQEYKGNNYAYKATKLLSKVADEYNIDKLIITARPDNVPSIKTIEKLDGIKFLEIKKVPKRTKLHRTSKFVAVYEWNIQKEGNKYDRH